MATAYTRKIPLLDCGHDYIRQVLHGRWKIALLLRLAGGPARPGELARRVPQATRRVLDAQLGQLVEHGLVQKTTFAETVPRVEYQLTPLGESLLPVLAAMGQWGEVHLPHLRATVK